MNSNWLPISELGGGSFGRVYLALSLADGGIFAAKYSGGASAPAAAAAQLRNEIHILRSLSSPFVVQYLGSDIQNGYLFIEFMDGGSLHGALKRQGPLPVSVAGGYTRSILSALQYLHETAGVAHGDVKSHNVLLSSGGDVKLADFGAAQHYSAAGGIAFAESGVSGTPLWMAPEVALGDCPASPASDIWSLGCTVMEMLRCLPPWLSSSVDNSQSALLRVACSESDPVLPSDLASCSEDAQDFLRQCLRRNPKDRPSAAQLLQHPFVNLCEDSAFPALISPRSIIYGVESLSCTSSDSSISIGEGAGKDDMSATRTAAISPSEMPERPFVDLDQFSDGNWVTVRSSDGWSDDRKLPFMAQSSFSVLQRRSGDDVQIDSIAFLSRRW